MSEAATVSVIMPVKNGARYIAEAIRSALDQGDKVGELIVIDDASTDDTVGVVRAIDDPRIAIVPNHSRGLPAGRNTGAALAVGAWLHFLDSDDRLRPGALDALLEGAAENSRAAVVYGDYERIDAAGCTIGNRAALRARRRPTGDFRRSSPAISLWSARRSCAATRTGKPAASTRPSAIARTGTSGAASRPSRRFAHVPGCHVLDYRIHGASMMHATPRPFGDLLPAIDAVFGDERIVGRFPAGERAALRQAAEASMMTYVATEAIRLRAYRTAARSAVRAIAQKPAGAPKVLAKVLGTFAGL
jgi:hypothetical protein